MVKNKVRENRYNWVCEKRVHRKTLETTENIVMPGLRLIVSMV